MNECTIFYKNLKKNEGRGGSRRGVGAHKKGRGAGQEDNQVVRLCGCQATVPSLRDEPYDSSSLQVPFGEGVSCRTAARGCRHEGRRWRRRSVDASAAARVRGVRGMGSAADSLFGNVTSAMKVCKRIFCAIFMLKINHLPRQARDKHWKS